MKSLGSTADAKGVTLDLNTSEAPKSVFADPTRFHQIVWNIVSNAVKFTSLGGRVSIVLKSANSEWSLIVEDTGQGIDPDFLPFAFDRFRQEDASKTKRYGGLGLGLSTVKHLVELHGGQIKVESKGVGKGAKFTVMLPQNGRHKEVESSYSQPKEIRANMEPQSGLGLVNVKVLLVEDSPDSRLLVHRMLERAGAIVVDADCPREARAKLMDFCPQIIVSDIGMPEENGFEFMRKLRSFGDDRIRNVPAIALTAFVREDEKREALAAGFQIHVSKPVTSARRLVAIQQLVRI